jgi:Mn-containing catalase
MQDIRSAASFYSYGGGAVPVNSNSMTWNVDMVTTTGNLIMDLLHNFHLECGARLHKLRVYETLTDPTGREVCGYLLVRGSVHAHAYGLALKKLTGVAIEQMLPTPNIPLAKIPECQKYLDEGSHRRLYRFGSPDYAEVSGVWSNDEAALCRRSRQARSRWWTARPRAARCPTCSATTAPSPRTTRRRRCSRWRPSST